MCQHLSNEGDTFGHRSSTNEIYTLKRNGQSLYELYTFKISYE